MKPALAFASAILTEGSHSASYLPGFQGTTHRCAPLDIIGRGNYTTSPTRLSRGIALSTRFFWGLKVLRLAPSLLLEATYTIPCRRQLCQGGRQNSPHPHRT